MNKYHMHQEIIFSYCQHSMTVRIVNFILAKHVIVGDKTRNSYLP